MRRITNLITSQGEYLVVELDNVDPDFSFGTINLNDIENGRLKRKLNGFDMCLAESVEKAIQKRLDNEHLDNLLKTYPVYEAMELYTRYVKDKYFKEVK